MTEIGLFGTPLRRKRPDGTWEPRDCDGPVTWHGTDPMPPQGGDGSREGDYAFVIWSPAPPTFLQRLRLRVRRLLP